MTDVVGRMLPLSLTVTVTVLIIAAPQSTTATLPDACDGDAWVVPPVVASRTRLPAPAGCRVTWSVDGQPLASDILVNRMAHSVIRHVTGSMAMPDGRRIVRAFTVRVLGRDGHRLLGYSRTPTTAHDANQAVVARSLHLALGRGASDAEPLNGNYGVVFAQGDPIDVDRVALRGIADPSLFYFADGSLGVIATRVAIDGAALTPDSALVFKADPSHPTQMTELGPVDLGAPSGVSRPFAVWDTATRRYWVGWTGRDGRSFRAPVKDLARTVWVPAPFILDHGGRRSRIVAAGNVGPVEVGRVTTISSLVSEREGERLAGSDRISILPIDEPFATAIERRFGRIVNVGAFVPAQTVSAGSGIAALRATRVTLTYSDGSRATRAVDWNAADLRRVAAARTGRFRVRGMVRQQAFPRIFAYERADPMIYRYDHGGRTRYLFVATDDTDNDNVGSAHLPIRVADTIAALADDAGGRRREVDLLNRRTRRDRTAEGRVIAGCYWAPELHEIAGRLSILFAPCFNPQDDRSSDGGAWFTVQSHIMQLRVGGDPANPADWSAPAAIRRADGSPLGRRGYPDNISLDMSYFVSGGRSYYIWSQRYLSRTDQPGDPLTWIARVDPRAPTRLLSEPRPLIVPTLSFEENLAEGGFVLHHGGHLTIVYSASGVSPTYVVGGVRAAEGGDLTRIDRWRKWSSPLQKSMPMPAGTTDYRTYEQGPGHGAFTIDEDGNTLYVYHSWGNGVGRHGRDARIRRMHWAADGRPILDMTAEEELAPGNRAVTMKVLVTSASRRTNSRGSR